MIEGPKELGVSERLRESKPLTPPPSLVKLTSMRYLVVLEALGRGWEGVMRSRGVDEATVESWSVYYNQLTMSAATCPVEELRAVGQRMASCFRTAMWYIEKEAGE